MTGGKNQNCEDPQENGSIPQGVVANNSLEPLPFTLVAFIYIDPLTSYRTAISRLF